MRLFYNSNSILRRSIIDNEKSYHYEAKEPYERYDNYIDQELCIH